MKQKKNDHYFLFIFHAGVDAVDCEAEPKNNEGRLRKSLFCDYDKDNRPALTDDPFTIKFKMIIKGFSFDSNTLKVSTWLAMVVTSIRFLVFKRAN